VKSPAGLVGSLASRPGALTGPPEGATITAGAAAVRRRGRFRSPEMAMAGRAGLTAFTKRVHHAVRSIPYGSIASYGGIAAIMGQPRAARAVGRALCMLEDGSDVPWWRVVNRNGEISIKCSVHGPALQRALLEGEGIEFDRVGRVDWSAYGWDGSGVPDGVRVV
jgi:methylated-DNA-protein-cysteine methyltransferase-like protein